MHTRFLTAAILLTATGAASGQNVGALREPEPIQRYQVEIIVFANRDFDRNEERFEEELTPSANALLEPLLPSPTFEEPSFAPTPEESVAAPPLEETPLLEEIPLEEPVEDPLAVRTLTPDELQLGPQYRRLQNLGAYTPLVHGGWVQPGLPEEQSVSFDLGQLGALNPRGTVQVYLSRFLHVNIDLTYKEPAPNVVASPAAFGNEIRELTLAPRYRLVTQRQLRSGELHYFDHPAFGVLLKVTPVPTAPKDVSPGGRPAA